MVKCLRRQKRKRAKRPERHSCRQDPSSNGEGVVEGVDSGGNTFLQRKLPVEEGAASALACCREQVRFLRRTFRSRVAMICSKWSGCLRPDNTKLCSRSYEPGKLARLENNHNDESNAQLRSKLGSSSSSYFVES